MVVFHSDIDSTLVYSPRWSFEQPKTCVELVNDKPRSYMLDTSITKLNKLLKREDVLVVPTTARNFSQVSRIKMFNFKYMITSNGGILIKDGKVDEDWYQQSLALVDVCRDVLNDANYILNRDLNVYDDVLFSDGLFLRALSNDANNTVELLKNLLGNPDSVNIFNIDHKVYVFPLGIDKNTAIERFKTIIPRDVTLLADDSLNNYSDNVDLFLTNDKGCLDCDYTNTLYLDGILSERVLNFVLNFEGELLYESLC